MTAKPANYQKGIPGVPLAALDSIADQNVQQVLRAMVDGWQVRNGSSGTGNNRFVTIDELKNVSSYYDGAINSLRTSGGGGSGNFGGLKPGDVVDLIADLEASVMESLLWKELGERITLIEIDTTKNAAAIVTEVKTRLDADNAIVTSTTTQFAVINGNVAAVQTQTSTLANNVAAVSQQLTTMQSVVGGFTSALQIEAQTRANADGDLYGKYSVKIDQNGYVSGFGLMSQATVDSRPYSDFIVRADRFAIGSPEGPGIAARVPFIVLTTPTTVNGRLVQPGVYMRDAVIANGLIANAMIGVAEIDTLTIRGQAVTVPDGISGEPNIVIAAGGGTYEVASSHDYNYAAAGSSAFICSFNVINSTLTNGEMKVHVFFDTYLSGMNSYGVITVKPYEQSSGSSIGKIDFPAGTHKMYVRFTNDGTTPLTLSRFGAVSLGVMR